MKRLNGWQRLFVVAASLWLVAVAVWTVHILPKADDWRRTWRAFAEAEVPAMRHMSGGPWCDYRAASAPGENPYQVMMECDAATAKDVPEADRKHYMEVISKGEAAIQDELPAAQWGLAGGMFLWWLIPSLLLYVAGLVVAWVVRGFRKSG